MLKSIIKKLNGHAAEPSALTEALQQLGRDRAETDAEIVRLNGDRRQALLDDAPDATLDKVERLIDRAQARLEKLGLAEAALREQLATATAAVRQQRWQSHLAAHSVAAQEFLTAARAAAEKHAALIQVMNTARREGFESEATRAMPATPNVHGNPICDPAALDAFERLLRPAPRAPGRAPRGGVQMYQGQPNSAPYDPTRPPGAPKHSSQHAVAVDVWTGQEVGAMVGSRAPRLPDDEQPLADGEVRAVTLRGGYEAPDGVCQSGRRIRLPRDVALAGARSGSIEIVEDPLRRAVESASDRTFHPVGSLADAHADPTRIDGGQP